MFRIPFRIINEIQFYKEKLNKFLSGEITDAFFKGIRVPWGFYSQRGGKMLMSRLRIPAGILTSEQLKAIGDASLKFADGRLHITTRQDIQIHNVPFENSIKIIEYLKDYNISPRGGGGNTVRNITACYLSGICPSENYEVYKLNWGLTEYLLTLDESYNLPRKFKIGLSGCERDCAFCGVEDVGIVALKNNKFKILVGGGMGAKSAVGKIIEQNIELTEIPYAVKSVFNVFNKYGDRKNRHHNRLRFLIEDIGWDEFFKLYKKEFEKIKETEYIPLKIENQLNELPELKKGNLIGCSEDENYNKFIKYNTGAQKQDGYYYAQIRVSRGEISGEQLISLAELETEIPNLIFRTTQRQNILISNIPFNKMFYVYEKVKSLFNDFLYPETMLDIISCKSVSTCNLGICNAIAMVPEIEKKLKELNIDKLKNIRINISGCPNACGQHPIGTIGLSGLARKVYNKTMPFYKIYFGASIDAENTKLAEEVGMLPARIIPQFIYDFLLFLQNNEKRIKNDDIKNLISKYSYIPSYEEDKSYYIDFGKTEEFSLEGLTAGECGAGVIDMIESDLSSANQMLIRAVEKNYDIDEIKKSIIFSARALLVIRGIDPKNENEAIDGFISKFVETGIAKKEFKNLKEIYYKINTPDKSYFNYAQSLYNEVKRIYNLMDSNFNFPIETSENISENEKPSQVYDLRGTPCPINYVKVKLKLEEMKSGEILEVYLDDGEPIRNVPESLKNDGHQILSKLKEGNYYKIKVQKK